MRVTDSSENGASPSPARRAHPLFLLVSLGISLACLYYLVGGGRASVDGIVSRLISRAVPMSSKDATEHVRAHTGGPDGLTVLEHLDIAVERLSRRGIRIEDRLWDCTESGESGSRLVTCTLRGPGHETRIEWLVDGTGAVTPHNRAAVALDQLPLGTGRETGRNDLPIGSDAAAARPAANPPSGSPNPRPSGEADPREAPLSLLGVFTSPSGNVALIETHKGQVQVHEGERVGEWKVAEIRPRSLGQSSVVLVGRNQRQELRMAEARASQPTSGQPSAPASGPPPSGSPGGAPDMRGHPPSSPADGADSAPPSEEPAPADAPAPADEASGPPEDAGSPPPQMPSGSQRAPGVPAGQGQPGGPGMPGAPAGGTVH